MSEVATSSFQLTPQFAAVAGALLTLVGALAGHYVSRRNTVTTASKDIDVKKIEVENTYKLELAKHEHQVDLEAQKFVRDIIMKTLEKGTAQEQTRNLKSYAKINLIGSPYKEALLSLADEELPSIEAEILGVFNADIDNINPPEFRKLLTAAEAVGCLVSAQQTMGTGFLVSDRLLLTASQVLPRKEVAQSTRVQFAYEVEWSRVQQHEFALDPDAFFVVSDDIGYAMTAVHATSTDGVPLKRFGRLEMSPVEGKILVGDAIHIVHHPRGAPKKILFRVGPVSAITTQFVRYGASTEAGSSGAPVMNCESELIAVHSGLVAFSDGNGGLSLQQNAVPGADHRGGTREDNYGIRIGRVLADLRQVEESLEERQAALLRALWST